MANSIKDVMEALESIADSLSKLNDRVAAVEKRPGTTGSKPRKRSAKPKSNFTVVEPTAQCKYRRYKAWYVVGDQKPYEKTFWSRKRMESYNWGLGKLYGKFVTYTDMPSIN